MAERLRTYRRSVDVGDAEAMWPRELAGRFDESELVGQFRLSEFKSQIPTGWRREILGAWHLVHDAALPVMRIIAHGAPVGWILGHPVSGRGTLLEADLELDAQGRMVGVDFVEDLLDDFAGRFVAIIVGLDAPRIYLDAAGSMGVVFSANQRVAASSVFLIPYVGAGDDRIAFVRGRGALAHPPHLYFGLTIRNSVDWLLPSYFLNLSTWQAVRHWPRGGVTFTTEVGQTVEFVAERLSRSIRAVVETGLTQMSLTAGMDTRVLIACARDLIADIDFVTYVHSDRVAHLDVAVARQIARRMGLRHRVIRRQSVSDRDVARFLYRTGGVGATVPRTQEIINAVSRVDKAMSHIAGTAGEMNRLPSLVSFDDESERLTISRLLELRNQPAYPEVVERGARWLDELPVDNPYTVFDLRVLEMRYGGWNGFHSYAHVGTARFFSYPFVDRRVIEALVSLPVAYRRQLGVVKDIILSRWPELLEIPFDHATSGPYGWYRRARRFAKRTLRR